MKKRWTVTLFLSFLLTLLLVSLSEPASAAMTCVWCDGKGEVRCTNCTGIDYTCSKCHGRGYVRCIYCNGTGVTDADIGTHDPDDPGGGTGSDGSGTDSHPSSIYCGDNLTWNLSSDGVLTISGTGLMIE